MRTANSGRRRSFLTLVALIYLYNVSEGSFSLLDYYELPLPLTDTLVRKLREVLGQIKEHERRILDLSTRVARMPRKDFIKAEARKVRNLDI